MKIGWLIVVLILGIIVSFLIAYAVALNYNLNNNPEFVNEYCQKRHESRNGLLTPCQGNWTYQNRDCYFKCHFKDENSNDLIISECADVSPEYLQDCCERWAYENDIVRVSCEGVWRMVEKKCFWDCS